MREVVIEVDLVARVAQSPIIAGEVPFCWLRIAMGTGQVDLPHNVQLLAQSLLGAVKMKPPRGVASTYPVSRRSANSCRAATLKPFGNPSINYGAPNT
jgi:hypothetical protein